MRSGLFGFQMFTLGLLLALRIARYSKRYGKGSGFRIPPCTPQQMRETQDRLAATRMADAPQAQEEPTK